MRKFVERTLAGRVELLLSLLALSFVPGAGDSGLEAQEPDRIPVHQVRADDLTPELDSLFDTFLETIRDSMTVHDVPGLSIAVVDRDRTLWSAGFGVRDRDSGEPVTPGTVFSVQSISKLFTGVTAMKAVEDGLLELDAVVTDYLPDFTVNSRFSEDPVSGMTVRHLLRHAAGLPHEGPVGNNWDAYSPSTEAHVRSISDTWLEFPVGTGHAYSNLGYDLVGYIIQKQSGRPYQEYMAGKLLDPLGMASSFVDTAGQRLCPACAAGHRAIFDSMPEYVPMTASGGVRASAEDAARFAQFLLRFEEAPDGTRVLGASSFDEIYGPTGQARDRGWPDWWFGMGVIVQSGTGEDYLLHTHGGGFGYRASLEWMPEVGIGAAVFTNSDEHDQIDADLADAVLDSMVARDLLGEVDAPGVPRAESFFKNLPDTTAYRSTKTARNPTPYREDPPTWTNIELERVGPADTAALDLEECDIPGLERPARCGTLEVPEDRGHPDGRRIGLRVVLVPARERPAEPDPVFFLSGGPGQAATADAASEAGGPIGRRRDMVFVDQRGTGESRPLSCDLDGVQASADMYLAGRVPLDRVAGCLEKLEADPRHYWTGPAVEDLDDVRAALGYEEINLKGGSYGTRVAVVYARRHPEHTRTLLLSGVTPMSYRVPLPHPRESQRALDSLAAACETDRSCREDYGDVAGLLSRVTADLERRSRTVTVSSPGLPESARITLDTGILRGAVHLTLYDVDTAARLPALLAAADRGDYGPLAAWAAGLTAQLDQALHLGMLFSVICAEDEPRISPSEVDPATEGTYLGGQYVRGILSACEVWPAAEVEDDYFEPVATEVPTLMISGAVDPVTPPRWAEAVERRLPNARHLVVPGRGHTPGLPECAEELPVRFLDRASADGLDAACLEAVERPAFEDGGAG